MDRITLANASDCLVKILLAEKLSATDKDEVERIVRAELKDKDTDEKIVKIVRNVLVQFTKTLYNRRSFWSSTLNSNPD